MVAIARGHSFPVDLIILPEDGDGHRRYDDGTCEKERQCRSARHQWWHDGNDLNIFVLFQSLQLRSSAKSHTARPLSQQVTLEKAFSFMTVLEVCGRLVQPALGRCHLPALLPWIPQLQDQVSDTEYCNGSSLHGFRYRPIIKFNTNS